MTRQKQFKFVSIDLMMIPSKHSWNSTIKLMLISRCQLTRMQFLDTMNSPWSFLYDEMYGPDDEKNYVEWKKNQEGKDSDYELTADGFVWPKAE